MTDARERAEQKRQATIRHLRNDAEYFAKRMMAVADLDRSDVREQRLRFAAEEYVKAAQKLERAERRADRERLSTD